MGLMDWASGVRATPGVGAGLLGGDWNSDPTKNDAIRKALMAAGFGMLSNVGRGNFAQGLGQAGMAGMGAYEQTLEDKRRQDMQAFQFDQAKQQAEQQRQVLARQQRLDALPAQFMRPGGGMAVDATGGMETAVDAPQNVARPAGFDTPGYIQALMGIDPVQAIRLQEMTKQATPTPIKLGQGDQLLDPTTFQPLATNPKDTPEKAPPEALRALALVYGEGSPEYKAAARRYAEKLTSHQPGVNISYGSPVPVQLPDGNTGYIQPSNRGGVAAPVTLPDGRVATRPVDTKERDLTEAQSKATTFLAQMRSATDSLRKLNADQTALSMQAETALAGGPANIAITQKAQQVRQAQDQWAEAYLRFKTGAAATDAEVANNRKTFFPAIGDKPETVAQKKAMRAAAERDMEIAAGRGAGQLNKRDATTATDDPWGIRGR